MTTPNDRDLLAKAVHLSRVHMEAKAGGPFGALIARPDGTVVAEGWNEVTSANDPTAHAEVVAIRRACAALGTFDLSGYVIYSSCEPCPMCLAAVGWARLDRLVFANDREDAAAIGFDDAALYDEVCLPVAERRMVRCERIVMPEARAVFDDWAAMPDKVAY